jgi:hypothetical protein
MPSRRRSSPGVDKMLLCGGCQRFDGERFLFPKEIHKNRCFSIGSAIEALQKSFLPQRGASQ